MKSKYFWLPSIFIVGNVSYGQQDIALAESPVSRDVLRNLPVEVSQRGVNLPGSDRGIPDSTAGGGARNHNLDRLRKGSGRGSPSSTVGAGSQLYLPSIQGFFLFTLDSVDTWNTWNTKGFCLTQTSSEVFRAILPQSSFGTTARTAQPKGRIWFYIPENTGIQAELEIFPIMEGGMIGEALVKVPIENIGDRQGFVGIEIPTEMLTPGQQYFWDFNITCNPIDRSADLYLQGSLEPQDINTLNLVSDETVIQALEAALLATDSALTLPDRMVLGAQLAASEDPTFVDQIAVQLRTHYQDLLAQYAITAEPSLALELAQISALFGLWGDTVDFLAPHREEYPEAWQMLQQTFSGFNDFSVDEGGYLEEENPLEIDPVNDGFNNGFDDVNLEEEYPLEMSPVDDVSEESSEESLDIEKCEKEGQGEEQRRLRMAEPPPSF